MLRQGLTMEYMAYNYFNYEVIRKMLLLHLVE